MSIYTYLPCELKKNICERLRFDLPNSPSVADNEIKERNRIKKYLIQKIRWNGNYFNAGYEWETVDTVTCDGHDIYFYIGQNYKRLSDGDYGPSWVNFRHIEDKNAT